MKPMSLNTMIRLTMAALLVLAIAAVARAGDADTQAWARSGRGGPGAAGGQASYRGDVGFARTESRSGRVSAARSVAVGVDERGLSLSISTAVAPARGPALGTTFNVAIDRDGDVATSVGASVAAGGLARAVEVGGGTSTGIARPTAVAQATGRTEFGGIARAVTRSDSGSGRKAATIRLSAPEHSGGVRRTVGR